MIVPETVFIVAFGGDEKKSLDLDVFTDFESFHVEEDALQYFSHVVSHRFGRVALYRFNYAEGVVCWQYEFMGLSYASTAVTHPENAAKFCYAITKAYACLVASMFSPVSLADDKSEER